MAKWGWSMILYCAVSYYLAAALSTDTLNWFPSAFTAYHGWDASIVNLCNAMAGIGGWLGVIAAVVFSIMAAKWGSRFMAVLGNFVCGVLCIIFACTTNITVFLAMVVILTFVSGNIQLNVVPNNIMNIWFPKKKGLALGWASMGLPLCTATITGNFECNWQSKDRLYYFRYFMLCSGHHIYFLGKKYTRGSGRNTG